jgi:hypothetical protein
VDLEGLLSDAHRAVVDRIGHGDGAEEPPARRPHRAWLLACIASWLAVLAVTTVPPPALRPAEARPYQPPPRLEEASLRWGLWLARNRVELHRVAARRLPSSLGETGFDDPRIRFEPLPGGRYQLVADLPPDLLILDDRTDPDAFLGTALEELQAAR